MATARKRTYVIVPEDLLRMIDQLVGRRKRSQFITEAAWREVNRLMLLKALEETSGAWREEDHPEFEEGSYSWVKRMREQDERRYKEVT